MYLCNRKRITKIYMKEKELVTQDFLYEYLTEHNVTMRPLAELMGSTASMLICSFRRTKGKNGAPRSITNRALPRLNAALPKLAWEIKKCVIPFGSDEVFTNSRGNTYDPALVPIVKNLSNYFNLTGFLFRILGWNEGKKSAALCAPKSKFYGHISADDISKINSELLAISKMLCSIEVVADREKPQHHTPVRYVQDDELDLLEEQLLMDKEG